MQKTTDEERDVRSKDDDEMRIAWANVAQARHGEEPVNVLLYLKLLEPSDIQTSGPVLPPLRVRVRIVLGTVQDCSLA